MNRCERETESWIPAFAGMTALMVLFDITAKSLHQDDKNQPSMSF
jgi:hypothetical protein